MRSIPLRTECQLYSTKRLLAANPGGPVKADLLIAKKEKT
jgi:hypothetical protein